MRLRPRSGVARRGGHKGCYETAAEICTGTGADVTAVAADLCTEDGRAALVAACPDPDILVTNNGGPMPGRFEDCDHAMWLAGLEQNLLAPALMIRAVIGGCERRSASRRLETW